MAFELSMFRLPGLVASGDLSGAQYELVKLDSNGRVAVAGAGQAVVGVLENKPDALDKPARVSVGVVKVKLGGNYNPGAIITPNGSGEAVSPPASGEYPSGVLLEGGSTGELATAFIFPSYGQTN